MMTDLIIYSLFTIILSALLTAVQFFLYFDRMFAIYQQTFYILLNRHYQNREATMLTGKRDAGTGLEELSAEYIRSIFAKRSVAKLNK